MPLKSFRIERNLVPPLADYDGRCQPSLAVGANSRLLTEQTDSFLTFEQKKPDACHLGLVRTTSQIKISFFSESRLHRETPLSCLLTKSGRGDEERSGSLQGVETAKELANQYRAFLDTRLAELGSELVQSGRIGLPRLRQAFFLLELHECCSCPGTHRSINGAGMKPQIG